MVFRCAAPLHRSRCAQLGGHNDRLHQSRHQRPARAETFYNALLGETGARQLFKTERMIGWGFGKGKPVLTLNLPFDNRAATPGNGAMVALQVDSKEEVDRLYSKAIELGAVSEGAAGPRGDSFYGGYFRDPDGNKLNFYLFQS